ncbi:MAG: hypothetical protein QOJ89_3988 [bacterium]
MHSIRTYSIALLTLLALCASASSAAASGRAVINDCTDDEVLSKTYTQQDYRDALAKLPADADQYGNCRDIIARAQDAAATKGGSKSSSSKADATTTTAGGGTGTGSGGPPPPSTTPASEQLAAASPEDRAAASAAAGDGGIPVTGPTAAEVGRAPGTDQVADLPAPVLALLAFLLVGALGLGAVRIRSLVRARRA